ncbi:MAG: hypothetical protein WCE69_02225, partial [Aestuariivirga sp.]
GNSEMQVSFVPLDGPWWILQATEASGSSYVLIKAEPKELQVSALDCKSLKEGGAYDTTIDFVESSCYMKPDADTMALFKSFAANPTEPSTKLVSEP